MLTLTLMSMVVTQAAELKSEAWVVVSQRSSVARGTALELARGLSTALAEAGVPTPTPADDLASCAAKVPCLVKAAREKGVGVLVGLEIGSALGDLVVRVAAYSIDEDGRVLQRAEADGTPENVASVLKGTVVPLFAPSIRTLLALPDPAAKSVAKAEPVKPEPVKPEPAKTEPEPVAKAEPAPVAQPATVSTTSSSGGSSPLKFVGLAVAGVGVVGVIVGIILNITANSALSQRDTLCPRDLQCNDPKAYDFDASFRSGQVASGTLLGVGAVLAVGGGALFLLSGMLGGSEKGDAEPGGPGENPGLSLAPVIGPGGGGVSLSGRF